MLKRIKSIICALIAIMCCMGCAIPPEMKESLGAVTILMYHNIIPNNLAQSTYEVNASTLKSDLDYIYNHGYTVLSVKELERYVYERKKLPEKCVMLTFDDGYMYNMTYALPLLEDYGYAGTFAVVGDFTKQGKSNTNCARYTYLEWEDIEKLSQSSCATVANHSYNLHKLNGRKGVQIKRGENVNDYSLMLKRDTLAMIDKFTEIGIYSDVYVYPYGLYSAESEKVLTEIGYNVTMTCCEGKNIICDKEDLHLMKRYNRSHKINISSILK